MKITQIVCLALCLAESSALRTEPEVSEPMAAVLANEGPDMASLEEPYPWDIDPYGLNDRTSSSDSDDYSNDSQPEAEEQPQSLAQFVW